MGIVYDEKQKTLTLHTKNTTYQMQVDRYGFLLICITGNGRTAVWITC